MDKKLDASYSTYPWGWHNKYVGRWMVEVPLSREKIGVFGHGCLLDIIIDLIGITGELFFPTQIECPCQHTLFERPVPLPPGIIREALDRQWSLKSMADEDFVPYCELYGLSHIYVNNPGGIVRALVPHALCFRLESVMTGNNPVARLSVYTKCDAWLEQTIDGLDNSKVGLKNAAILTAVLADIEERLAGKIVELQTEFENIEIEKYAVKNKHDRPNEPQRHNDWF
ncbi:hypothetical protein [Methanocella sp. MCL-LM]|uniref:hypothetical protein n=1 Tax=Methanocella sp. MCL-LM TaxID=3412035 RepID=UPI003C77E365